MIVARHRGACTLPPGPKLPAAAQALAFVLRPLDFLAQCHRRYGDTFTIDTLLFDVEVNVVHPDAIKQVFTGHPDTLRALELVLATVLARVRLRKARPEPAPVALRRFTFVPADGAEVVALARAA